MKNLLSTLFFARKTKILLSRFLLTIAVAITLFSFGKVFAETAPMVKFQVRANGNYIVEKTIAVPNGCTITDSKGQSYTYTGYRTICALSAANVPYSVSQSGNGLALDSLEGYNAPLSNCVLPKCWTYYVGGVLAPEGIDTFVLAQNDVVLFTYGNDQTQPTSQPVQNQPSVPVSPPVFQAPVSQPSVQPALVSSNPNSVQAPAPRASSSTTINVPPTVSQPIRQKASSSSSGCTIKFAWAPYQGTPTIFYGAWDSTYYVFVFPVGQTREQAVWERQVSGTETTAGGLTSGIQYEGEIFLHGAFLSNGKPFWGKFAPTTCTFSTTEVSAKKPNTANLTTNNANNNSTTSTPSPVLPEAKSSKTRVSTTSPNSAAIKKALAFLKNKQTAFGSIGNETESAWVALAFAGFGQSNVSLNNFLKTKTSLNTATDVERTILVAVATGIDQRNFGGVDLIQKLEGFHRNNQLGKEEALNDDIFGILALAAANLNNGTLSDSLSVVINNQNADGGWSFQKGRTSDVDTTAASIQALVAAEKMGHIVDQNKIAKAKEFLLSNQNADGGFRFSPNLADKSSNGASTAWALQASNALNESNVRGEQFLLLLQQNEGSFLTEKTGRESILVTSYSIISLEKKFLPLKPSVLGVNKNLQVLPDTGFEAWIFITLAFSLSLLGLKMLATNLSQTKNRFAYYDLYKNVHHKPERG